MVAAKFSLPARRARESSSPSGPRRRTREIPAGLGTTTWTTNRHRPALDARARQPSSCQFARDSFVGTQYKALSVMVWASSLRLKSPDWRVYWKNAAVKAKGTILEVVYRRTVPRLGYKLTIGRLSIGSVVSSGRFCTREPAVAEFRRTGTGLKS